jgi:hypothetical protein
VYQLVEANEGWVARRLEALAAALHLPGPVRDGFLFRADVRFYRECTESIVSLQRAARRVIDHLGLRCDSVVVSFRDNLSHAGMIELDGGHWFIEIAAQYKNDPQALGAILAHECCHILVAERRLHLFRTAVDEVHVDLACMLSGLGPLTLNGISQRFYTKDSQTYSQHRSFGYLRQHLLRFAYARVAAALHLGWRRALRDVDGLSWAELSWRYPWSLGARLHYAAVDKHVVVSCSCARRLRLPSGAVGKSRCPECKTERRFDGRALRTKIGALPLPMMEAPVPVYTEWLRAWIALERVPFSARVICGLVISWWVFLWLL